MQRPDLSELVALSERWRDLAAWRLALAVLVGGAALVGGTSAPGIVAIAALGYVVALATVVTVWHRRGRRSMLLHGLALLLDTALITIASTAAGTVEAVVAVAVVHVMAVSLLASHRSGIRIAGLFTVALVVSRDLTSQGALPWKEHVDGDATVFVALLVVLWVVAFVTGSMSAANERELRRRRHDLEQLNELSRSLMNARTVPAVVEQVLDRLVQHLGVRGAVLVDLHGRDVRLFGGAAPSTTTAALPGPESVLRRSPTDGRVLLVRRVGPADRWLEDLLPNATGVVVVRLPAREHHGALVIDTGWTGINRRTSLIIEQYAAAAAGALDGVTMLHKALTLAAVDGLTGIPNRRSFEQHLRRSVEEAAAGRGVIGLVLFDIDHFKRINDHHGHDVGDRVLAAVGRRLIATCRSTEIPARIGGEEFAVVVRETAPGDALRLAERLRSELSECDPLAPTASFGVVTTRGNALSPKDLYRAADSALYRAKANGRDGVVAA